MKKLFNFIFVAILLISSQTAHSQSCKANFDYWVSDTFNTYHFDNKGSFSSSYIYEWYFGDGNVSKAFSPNHTYKKNGTYTVCNIVYNTVSRCSDTLCIQVVANSKNPCNADFTANQDTSNPLKWLFTAVDTGEEKYSWQYNSSQFSSNKSSNYTFSSKGIYSITLDVINTKDHCRDTVIKTIETGCVAKFKFQIDHTKKTVAFTNQSSTITNNYTWKFADGTSSSSKNPTHTYSKSGSYRVLLFAFDSITKCGDSISYLITIKPTCNSTIFANSIDTTLQFYVFQKGRLSVQWDFGDSTSSNLDSGKHHYKMPGNYKVCVKVVCSSTDSSTSCKNVSISAKPKCKPNFGYKRATGFYNINFIDSSSGKYKYTWNFGDGTASNLKNPTHKYSKTGTYRVYLYVTDSSNSCTDSVSKLVTVYNPCSSTFTTSVKDTLLTYISTSANRKTVKWDFNDGTYSTKDSGKHVYSRPGNYNLCQTVYCLDNDSAKNCVKLTITNKNKCDNGAKIIAEQDTQSFVVNLKSSTTSTKYSVLWQYFGNKASSSTAHNISVKNGLPSFERVYLSIYDSLKNCVDTISSEIAFHQVGKKCVADFNFKGSTYSKFEYHFFSSTAGKGVVNTWIIDSVVQKPSKAAIRFTFKTTGKHNIILMIDDTLNKCKDTISLNIVIPGNCIQNYTWKTTKNFGEIEFAGDSTGKTIGYKWNFGDSTYSNLRKVTHKYKKAGSYKACLTVICSSTDSFVICKTITISSCKALFTVALDTNKKYKLFLINRSSNTLSTKYLWDFGDSTTSTSRNPTHSYGSFGKFNICLTVTDGGCSSTYCDTVGLDSTGKLLKASSWELVVLDEMVFGVAPVNKSTLKVYPNPANQSITIETGNVMSNFEKLEICDLHGKILIQKAIDLGNDSMIVDITGLNRGLYFIKLSNNESVIYSKMMKN
jgi:PKD repeat protein